MIVSQDIRPERQVYYMGALVLEAINELDDASVEMLELFTAVNRRESVSMNAFLLTLDWLFILNAIAEKEGRLIKCF